MKNPGTPCFFLKMISIYPAPLRTIMTKFFLPSVSFTEVAFQDLDVPYPSRLSSSFTPRTIGRRSSYSLGIVYGGLGIFVRELIVR